MGLPIRQLIQRVPARRHIGIGKAWEKQVESQAIHMHSHTCPLSRLSTTFRMFFVYNSGGWRYKKGEAAESKILARAPTCLPQSLTLFLFTPTSFSGKEREGQGRRQSSPEYLCILSLAHPCLPRASASATSPLHHMQHPGTKRGGQGRGKSSPTHLPACPRV